MNGAPHILQFINEITSQAVSVKPENPVPMLQKKKKATGLWHPLQHFKGQCNAGFGTSMN